MSEKEQFLLRRGVHYVGLNPVPVLGTKRVEKVGTGLIVTVKPDDMESIELEGKAVSGWSNPNLHQP